MTIHLSVDLERLIQNDVSRGGYQRVDQFVERAIRLLHHEEHLLQENRDAIHEAIGEGLARLDRGEGIPGEVSRARLQKMKAALIDSRKPKK